MSYCNSVVENFLLIHFSVDLIGDVKTIVTLRVRKIWPIANVWTSLSDLH